MLEIVKNARLRSRIFEQGFTQGEVCIKIGIRPNRLSEIVQGQRIAKPYERHVIAKALKCQERDIFE